MLKVLSRYCYLLAAVVTALHTFDRETYSVVWTIGVVAALIAAGRMLSWASRRWNQRRRDKKAAQLLRRITDGSKSGKASAYALFLRPFSTTSRLTIANPSRRWLPLLPGYFSHESTLEFETLLSEALAPDLPLIALGRPGEHIGAGRIETPDDEWRRIFERLVEHATWVVMIPYDQGETRWEVDWLTSRGYLAKVVWMMPPKLKSSRIDMQSYWDQVRQGLRSSGLGLPVYTPAGQFFRLGRTGRFFRGRYLPKLTMSQLKTTFGQIARP